MTLPIMSFVVTCDFSNLLMFLKMSVHQVGAESELIVFLISLKKILHNIWLTKRSITM